MKKKILLVYPGEKESECATFPLSLLYIGSSIKKAGYDIELLDMRVDDRKIDFSQISCVGISSMTGSQIKQGLKFAQNVRAANRYLPIIWGGVHPTIMPEQTAKDEMIDFVVRNEGEETFVELVRCLANNSTLEKVKGISFKSDGAIINSEDRDFINLDNLDIEIPYNLLRLEKYQHVKNGSFSIQTSRGCPHRCGYCYNRSFNKSKYRAKSPQRVLDEMEYIVKRFKPKHIQAIEDNFFVNKNRVKEICTGIINRKLNVRWTATCRIDYILKFDDDYIKLLETSGCHRLAIGAESGSNKILSMISKDLSKEQILEGFKKLSNSTISLDVTFMCGFPGESYADTKETFKLIDQIRRYNKKAYITAIYVFTPYPGTTLYDKVVKEYGFIPPVTLRDWSEYKTNLYPKSPWLSSKQKNFYATLSILTRFPFYGKDYEIPPHIKHKKIFRILSFFARKRWQLKFFKFSIEWYIVKYYLEHTRGYV